MKNTMDIVTDIEQIIKISFNNKNLIEIALTHSSYANQKKNVKFNERLEFLGDAVLQLVISEYLFKKISDKPEGELTKLRSIIVCENSLFEIAKKWNVGQYIKMSKGEEITGGRSRVSILADCIEAIIAAVYIDKGFEVAKEFILNNFSEIITKAIDNKIILDYKTKLQEILQKNGEIIIEYELDKYQGPPHRRKFYTHVSVDKKILGFGIGYSKKESEQNAANNALEKMEG